VFEDRYIWRIQLSFYGLNIYAKQIVLDLNDDISRICGLKSSVVFEETNTLSGHAICFKWRFPKVVYDDIEAISRFFVHKLAKLNRECTLAKSTNKAADSSEMVSTLIMSDLNRVVVNRVMSDKEANKVLESVAKRNPGREYRMFKQVSKFEYVGQSS
jgi:hypothetical protein